MVRTVILKLYQHLKPWLDALEAQEMADRGDRVAPGLHPFPSFLCRLVEEIERAERYRLQLGLVVFHVAWNPANKQ